MHHGSGIERTCPTCSTLFVTRCGAHKYCGPICAKQGYSHSAKSYNKTSRRIRPAIARTRFSNLKATAKVRNIPVSLTLVEYNALTHDAVCRYCAGSLPLYGGGVDRINNTEGYLLGNCVPCCSTCNMMKGELSKSAFLEHIRTILSNA